MQEVKVSHLSTQANVEDGIRYNFRDLSQVEDFVFGVCNRYRGESPFRIMSYGLPEGDPSSFIQSIDYFADVYSKRTGILLRGAFVELSKSSGLSRKHVIEFADRFSQYYLFQGVVIMYAAYEYVDRFVILYLINPICYHDGSKYRPNNNEVVVQETEYALQSLDNVLGIGDAPNYRSFLCYPVSELIIYDS